MAILRAREFYYDDGDDVHWWYTHDGYIVKWALFFGLFGLLLIYIIGGRIHASRRMAKGLPPLAYHRWLVNRRQLAAVDPRYPYPGPTGYAPYTHQPPPPNDGGAYGLYAMPPPVYDPTAPRPPGYDQPPQQEGAHRETGGGGGGSKVDPDQRRDGPSTNVEEYAPPAGPPPSAMLPQGTGASNNPYRQ